MKLQVQKPYYKHKDANKTQKLYKYTKPKYWTTTTKISILGKVGTKN